MKHNDEFRQFQRDHVRLNKTRRRQLGEHMTALHNYLSNHLPGFRGTERQGSHALRTIIRPTTDEAKADADIMVMMDLDSADCRTYVPKVAETLQASDLYKDKIVVKTRCVTVEYSEPSKCEVDLVPSVERDGRFYVCPRDGADFEETDGTGFREWFNYQNNITSGNLKRVVRVLKYARDHREQFECPSIVLTTLAGQAIRETDTGTEGVSTQADTLATVLKRMSDNLAQMPYPPAIKNPALPTETFDPHWTQDQYRQFRATIRQMSRNAESALQENDRDKSIAQWQKVCGEKFGGGNGNGGTSISNSRNSPKPGTTARTRSTPPPPVILRTNEARPFG